MPTHRKPRPPFHERNAEPPVPARMPEPQHAIDWFTAVRRETKRLRRNTHRTQTCIGELTDFLIACGEILHEFQDAPRHPGHPESRAKVRSVAASALLLAQRLNESVGSTSDNP